jgi:hypothetical protein
VPPFCGAWSRCRIWIANRRCNLSPCLCCKINSSRCARVTCRWQAQRSGPLDSSNRVPWRGSSGLKDKGPNGEDLTGAASVPALDTAGHLRSCTSDASIMTHPHHTHTRTLHPPGGLYDAGDTMKLGFPFAFTTSTLAWGLLQWREGYIAAGQLAQGNAKASVPCFVQGTQWRQSQADCPPACAACASFHFQASRP